MGLSIVNSNVRPSYIPDYPTIHGPVEDNGATSYYVWTNPVKGWDILVAGEQVRLPTGSGILSGYDGKIALVMNEAVLNQTIPLSEWVIEHNFNRHPSYYTVETDGKVTDCLVRHSDNYTSAYFSGPKSGTLIVGF